MMERRSIYKLGVAILFYAIYFNQHFTNVNGLEVDVNSNRTTPPDDDYFVYYQGVQGRPGKDFPVFSRIPRTSFSCKEVESGYYADLETNCQVFHICNEGTKVSFLCPNGTIFQQADLICDWWFKVNCTNSPNLYEESAEQLREALIRRKASRRVLNPGAVQFTRKMDVVGEQRHGRRFNYNSEEETQITQETGSFYRNQNHNYYPNHRQTYSDIQDPKRYQPNQYANGNAINNGQPFIVSTPKLGYTTAKPFKYSPTVPIVTATTARNHPTEATTTTSPRKYNKGYAVETFTNPPSVNNGKSATSSRKSKTKLYHQDATKTASTTASPNKVFRISLQSDGVAKPVHINKSPVKLINLKSNEGVKPLSLSLENEIPKYSTNTQRPAAQAINGGFYVTKPNSFHTGSITGSKNTYIPTTQTPTTITEYHSNTFGFVKPTGSPKPRPFELAKTTTSSNDLDARKPHDYFNYQISSASPFTNVPPTLPTTYFNQQRATTERYNYPTNVYNMLDTLKQIANVRLAKEQDFERTRPGLIVPPSVGPQTLHTLAVYFANALDNLNSTTQQPQTTTQSSSSSSSSSSSGDNNQLINSLFSMDTINKYHELFRSMNLHEEDNDDEDHNSSDDLDRDHSNNAVQSPRVRQLAKVFTQALSSYLDDPEMFKRVLQEVRPTEPPPLNGVTELINNEEDELLNFSDADIKPENPRLPTPAPAHPTWGYILAFNQSNHIDGNNNVENLQSADSGSFVAGYNDIQSNRVDKALKLPFNHWTSSPDVTKLWESTLYVNPLTVNQQFQTEQTSLEATTSVDFGSIEDTTLIKDDSLEDVSPETQDFVTESVIDYDLRALPQIDLNSTQVHGILIDFMNKSTQNDDSRFKHILEKFNTTQEEFLNKMKEIESNPLTRRLILLLVSECNNKTIDMKSSTVREIINLANNNQTATYHDHNSSGSSSSSKLQSSGFSKLVDKRLKDDDQDSRALQLLNSLYSIAAKYGK